MMMRARIACRSTESGDDTPPFRRQKAALELVLRGYWRLIGENT
jgi:hypothetical protein